jgi:hypothetical protein
VEFLSGLPYRGKEVDIAKYECEGKKKYFFIIKLNRIFKKKKKNMAASPGRSIKLFYFFLFSKKISFFSIYYSTADCFKEERPALIISSTNKKLEAMTEL